MKLYELENSNVIDLDKIDWIGSINDNHYFGVIVNGGSFIIYGTPDVDIQLIRDNLIEAWKGKISD